MRRCRSSGIHPWRLATRTHARRVWGRWLPSGAGSPPDQVGPSRPWSLPWSIDDPRATGIGRGGATVSRARRIPAAHPRSCRNGDGTEPSSGDGATVISSVIRAISHGLPSHPPSGARSACIPSSSTRVRIAVFPMTDGAAPSGVTRSARTHVSVAASATPAGKPRRDGLAQAGAGAGAGAVPVLCRCRACAVRPCGWKARVCQTHLTAPDHVGPVAPARVSSGWVDSGYTILMDAIRAPAVPSRAAVRASSPMAPPIRTGISRTWPS